MRWALIELYKRPNVTIPATDKGIRRPFHCLRHSFGTERAKQGVALPVLQRLMGHQDITTTMIYIDVDEGQKRDAIALPFSWATVGQQQQKKVATT